MRLSQYLNSLELQHSRWHLQALLPLGSGWWASLGAAQVWLREREFLGHWVQHTFPCVACISSSVVRHQQLSKIAAGKVTFPSPCISRQDCSAWARIRCCVSGSGALAWPRVWKLLENWRPSLILYSTSRMGYNSCGDCWEPVILMFLLPKVNEFSFAGFGRLDSCGNVVETALIVT